MIAAGWCRSTINNRVRRLKHVFKWAAGNELVPVVVHQALSCVAGLQQGRAAVRESEPVGSVDDAVVDATLPFLNRHVRGLVEFQRLTGCRPGEACLVRRRDLDMTGPTWLYTPARHKTAHRGQVRVIPVGPRTQAVLRAFFTPDIDDFLFSPQRAVAEFNTERSAGRATPRYASHMRRNAGKRAKNPMRPPAEKYSVASYGHAVSRACDRAFTPPAPLAQREGETRREWWGRLTAAQRAEVKAWRKAHHWHPNQLRHSFATRVRKEHGLEAAQVLLGHSRADVTQVYAEKNAALAAAVAGRIG
jgi:integrase